MLNFQNTFCSDLLWHQLTNMTHVCVVSNSTQEQHEWSLQVVKNDSCFQKQQISFICSSIWVNTFFLKQRPQMVHRKSSASVNFVCLSFWLWRWASCIQVSEYQSFHWKQLPAAAGNWVDKNRLEKRIEKKHTYIFTVTVYWQATYSISFQLTKNNNNDHNNNGSVSLKMVIVLICAVLCVFYKFRWAHMFYNLPYMR